jgi:hypothetical protein
LKSVGRFVKAETSLAMHRQEKFEVIGWLDGIEGGGKS